MLVACAEPTMVACAAPHVCATSCGAVRPTLGSVTGSRLEVEPAAAATGVSGALLEHHVTCMMEIAESIAVNSFRVRPDETLHDA